jgi:hypothetical protein
MKNKPNQAENSIWRVSSTGHEIRELFQCTDFAVIGAKTELFNDLLTSPLTSTVIVQKTHTTVTQYSPLEFPNLYLKFQNLKNRKEILLFANEWGLLGADVTTEFVESRKGGVVIGGDDVSIWNSEIRDMARACKFLTMLKANTPPNLSEFILRRSDSIQWHYKGGGTWFLKDELSKNTWESIRHNNDASNEAFLWVVLQTIVNKRLSRRMSSAVLREQDGNYVLRVIPEGLIGCLWYQFASAMTNSQGLRVCKKCGELFVPKHKDTAFCNTPKCKSKQQREHRKSLATTS